MGQLKKRKTLKDIADGLGVSTATVSNAFNRPDQLSYELRSKILEYCHQQGYSGPNAAARSLRTGKTGIVGIMLSNYLTYSFSDPVANRFLQGISEVLEQSDSSLLIIPSRSDSMNLHGYEAFVDGYIIYGPPHKESLTRLKSQNKFVVLADFIDADFVSVNIDNFQAAKACAEHALQHKSQTIGVIGLRMLNVDRTTKIEGHKLKEETVLTVQRLRGFEAAANAAGKELDPKNIYHISDNTHELAYQAANNLLTRHPRPDLILCMSDRIAIATIQAARHLGISVPDELMITGFDDIPESATQHPSITTIHQPSLEKGRLVAQMFDGSREAVDTTLSTQLVIRESCPYKLSKN